MTSQIRSHIKCLIQTDNILAFPLHTNVMSKSSVTDGFSVRFNENSEVGYLFGPPCTTAGIDKIVYVSVYNLITSPYTIGLLQAICRAIQAQDIGFSRCPLKL